MSAIRFTFPSPGVPTLPPLPPRSFTVPAAPKISGGFSAPNYTPGYSNLGEGRFTPSKAPKYEVPITGVPGTPPANTPGLPSLGAFPRAGDPGSAGAAIPPKPNITLDGIPFLAPIKDVAANVSIGQTGRYALPNIPAVPDLSTVLTLPTVEVHRLREVVNSHAAVEQAVRDYLNVVKTEYLDRKAMLAENKALADAAAKGFSGPVGLIEAEVLEIHHETAVTKRKAAEEVRDQVYETGRERLVTAISATVEAEMKYQMSLVEISKILISHDEQLISAGKQVLDELVQVYNKSVEVINETINDYQGYLDQVEAYNTAVSAANSVQIAKVENTSNEITLFEGQMSAVKAAYDVEATSVRAQALEVEEFKAYVRYAKAQAAISQEEIRAYADVVRAYSQSFGVRSAQLQAYAARVEAEGSAADVFQANASAYASFMRSEGARVSAQGQIISDQARAYSAEIQNYSRYAQAFRNYLGALNTGVQVAENGLQAWAQGARGAVQAATAHNRAVATYTGSVNAIELEKMDSANGRAVLRAQSDILTRRIEGSLKEAEAQALAASAQAAYSVASETARVSYGGQVVRGGSWDNSYRRSTNFNRSWSVTQVHEQDSGL